MKPKNQTKNPTVSPTMAHSLAIRRACSPEFQRAVGQQHRGHCFAEDDQPISSVPHPWLTDCAIPGGIAGEGGVHAQHMLDEIEVGAVVRDIVEHSHEGEGGKREDHCDFRVADCHGCVLGFLRRRDVITALRDTRPTVL
jgi:hypothetical protein